MANLARESDAKTLIIGATIDRTHCKIAKELVKKADVIRADALKAPFRNGVIFVVFSTMLIEHLDDQALTKEIHFILKKGGTLVLSTVMREEGAKYFYRNEKGEYLLAPDHLREYKSEKEVIKLLADNGLVTKAYAIIPTKFSLLDGLFRLLYRNMPIEILKTIVHQKPITYLRKKTKLPIPHYYDLEIIANKER